MLLLMLFLFCTTKIHQSFHMGKFFCIFFSKIIIIFLFIFSQKKLRSYHSQQLLNKNNKKQTTMKCKSFKKEGLEFFFLQVVSKSFTSYNLKLALLYIWDNRQIRTALSPTLRSSRMCFSKNTSLSILKDWVEFFFRPTSAH